ncbi:hypothetical protein OHC33_009833 [Knufia fluminis]|uniref:Tat pathway signal sequence domain protein n=1 Tax=Knufia fluminis TaxID=191047 RepID=A0AAN8EEV9_9EURO|nr:hypothetical protein OHC33_009833 [Knufia fluminis]
MNVRFLIWCLALAIFSLAGAQHVTNGNSDAGNVSVRWLGGTPAYHTGTTFGLPWPRGQHQAEAVRFSASANGSDVPLQSWVTAYWPDRSVKWTGHAIAGSDSTYEEYAIAAHSGSTASISETEPGLVVTESEASIEIDTGALNVTFAKTGTVLVNNIETASGKTVGQNGRLLLRSQSAVSEHESDTDQATTYHFDFESSIDNVTVSQENSVRALVTIGGRHTFASSSSENASHGPWLPFILRCYLYANSEALRLVHTIVYNGQPDQDFITGIGLRFDVPLQSDELYDRHIRLAGVDGGMLSEAVQGITGLRRDPGEEVRQAQFEGQKTPNISTWDERVSSRMQWIPTWNDYRLSQLSPDGFTLKKRTKAGQSWLNIPGGTRAGGLAYLGGATTGGLAVGLRDFWKKYPTSLDISNAATDIGEITVWLYSPEAQPLDLRPYHDGLGLDDFEKQLDALEITYEDYEPGYNTPYGVAKTSEIFVYGFDSTPSTDTLAAMTSHANEPPVLVATPEHVSQSGAIGTYWQPRASNGTNPAAQIIEQHLDFNVQFYINQVEQRRWYGFFDHGDIMHTYDEDRHTWRYDIGGYAWDNSELSPDLFFWLQFLRTGDYDLYRFSEALTRHTGETDVYHLGNFTGLGTRHGVQHWADSAKQVRIAQPQYRKVFYYISGGDERVGELLDEALGAEEAFLAVDPRRKVRDANITYTPDPEAILLDTGLDWSGLAAGWLIELERQGPRAEEAEAKLFATMRGIANLTNGLVTGSALYNSSDGTISPPLNDLDNEGVVEVSHLTAVFGLVEVIAELVDHLGDDFPQEFMDAWLDYCVYFGASEEEQEARYGEAFEDISLLQGHSRATAYAANRLQNATLASRAWHEFYEGDGLGPDEAWNSVRLTNSSVLAAVDEAAWLSTNDLAQYGLAAIQNLAMVGSALNATYT